MKIIAGWLAAAVVAWPTFAGDVDVRLGQSGDRFRVMDAFNNEVLCVDQPKGLLQLDQQQSAFDGSMNIGNDWQSFTVGRTGMLSALTIWHDAFHGSGSVTLGLSRGGNATGSLVWTHSAVFTQYWNLVSIEPMLPVTSGEIMSLHLSSDYSYWIGYKTGNPYAGGVLGSMPTWDMIFSTWMGSGTVATVIRADLNLEGTLAAGNVQSTGSVTAAVFVGSGSELSGIGGGSLVPGAVSNSHLAAGAVAAANLADGATLAEILDDDGSGSQLDADRLDGQDSTFYRNASNLNTGELQPARFSAYDDLGEEGFLNNDSSGDLPTRAQADTRYVNEGQVSSISADMLVDGTGSGVDADLLDGVHASGFQRLQASGFVAAGQQANVLMPHFQPFTLVMASEWPHSGGLATVQGFENDAWFGIAYLKYDGNGSGSAGGGEGLASTTNTLMSFGSGSTVYALRCSGVNNGSGAAQYLAISASNSALNVVYRLYY